MNKLEPIQQVRLSIISQLIHGNDTGKPPERLIEEANKMANFVIAGASAIPAPMTKADVLNLADKHGLKLDPEAFMRTDAVSTRTIPSPQGK